MEALVDAVRGVLQNVRADGRVSREIAAAFRKVVAAHQRKQGGRSAEDIMGALPPFESLSDDAQRALHAVILQDDSWSMWLRRAAWRHLLVRAARTMAATAFKGHKRIRNLLDQAELVLLLWHARLVHELYKGVLTWRGWVSREPTVAAALKIAGIDARTIASTYVRKAPQSLDTAAYWHDQVRHRTVGVVVGIDFIVNDEAVWFVESNLNAGLMEERSRLYERDPFVENMVLFARQNSYTSMTFLACNDYSVDRIMAARIEQTAGASGLRVTVMEDRNAPQGRLPQTFLVPPIETNRTLVVRSKLFHTALDSLFHNKTQSLAAIESYQRKFGDRDVRVPLTGAQSFPPSLRMESPFPNVVCKFPERDQGQGVVFLKVPSLARAQAIIDDSVEMNKHSVANIFTKIRHRLKLEDQTSVFQQYVPSSLLDGRRLYIARAHVLATPIGLTYLSAHRVVSTLSIPESLDEGLVENPRPYLVNYSIDSEHAAIPPDEELRVSKAALAVARALCWAVERRFRTGPGDTERRTTEQPAPPMAAGGARAGTGAD